MDYLTKIKQISKINISMACRELNIDRANLLNGKTSKENEKKVYYLLIEKIEQVKNSQ